MSATEQNHLQRIADQSRSLAEFYDQFLNHVCQRIDGMGAVAWECSQHPLRAIAQHQTIDDQPIKMRITEARHQELLEQAKKVPDPFFAVGDPTILLAKLRRGDAVDLIELFLTAGLEDAEYQRRLNQLAMICAEAAGITERKIANPSPAAKSISDSQGQKTGRREPGTDAIVISASQLDEYVHVLHQSLDPRATANRIANETRRVLDCDRVTVFKVTGNRVAAVAISGQPNVNRRSNTVACMQRLAQRVLWTRQVFWYPPPQPQPPQIEQRLNEYLTQSSTRSLVICPIFDIAKFADKKPGDRHETVPKLIGGIAVEQCDRQWDAAAITAPIEILSRHASDAFRNAYQHRQLLGYPLWSWLGKSKIVFAARHLSKTIAALVLLTLLAMVMAFVQTDFRMTCEGQLMPVTHRHVFANIDGVIDEVLVEHGDEVHKGQSLIRLKNLELEQQIQVVTGRIHELNEVIVAARSSMSGRSARSQEDRPPENIAALKAQLASSQRELELLKEKSKRLSIVSPIAGKVVTYDVRDLLTDRPVQRVESLLEVADLNGDWALELSLPDRKIGHVLDALEATDSAPLTVEFILAADPDRTHRGVLGEIGHAMTMTPEKGQCMTLNVSIEDPNFDLKQLRSGASAYIRCGRRSVGYAWFHSVWEFVQTKVLFPLL